MIDLHAHLLPGLDDGPGSARESVAMARVATRAGIEAVCCTPHMHPRYPTRPEQVRDGIAALAPELAREGIELTLLPGAEIDLVHLHGMSEEDLAASTLGGGGWILLEVPFSGWPHGLVEAVRDLELRGYRTVLAHPERAKSVQASPDRMRELVGLGALCQITTTSLTGQHGAGPRRTACALLRAGHAHLLASDAHSARWRPPDLREGLAAAAEALGVHVSDLSWMVEDGPAAIVEGQDARPPRLGRARPVAGRSR